MIEVSKLVSRFQWARGKEHKGKPFSSIFFGMGGLVDGKSRFVKLGIEAVRAVLKLWANYPEKLLKY